MMLPQIVPLDHASRIAEVRRSALMAARDEGLGEPEAGQVGIIATELATNGIKHADKAEIVISRLSAHDRPGVELVALDRGPGIEDESSAFRDGFSTAGTAGQGLGAIRRQSDEFDYYTQKGKGTVVVARKYGREEGGARLMRFAAVSAPYRGETVCGDEWAVRRDGSKLWVLVADGLGHGMSAHEASRAAGDRFLRSKSQSPLDLLQDVHVALKGTRGAAVGVAAFDGERVSFAGLGNIAGSIHGGGKPQNLLSHNGTAGLEARRCQEFVYSWPDAGTLVMHSDGLTTSWNLDAYPAVLRRHPAVLAALLYRDANRGRDDVCVVVGRRV